MVVEHRRELERVSRAAGGDDEALRLVVPRPLHRLRHQVALQLIDSFRLADRMRTETLAQR
jgi:hypothetical protein